MGIVQISNKIESLKEEMNIFYENLKSGEIGDFELMSQKLVPLFDEIKQLGYPIEIQTDIGDLSDMLGKISQLALEAQKDIYKQLKNLNTQQKANISYSKALENLNNDN